MTTMDYEPWGSRKGGVVWREEIYRWRCPLHAMCNSGLVRMRMIVIECANRLATSALCNKAVSPI